MQSLRGPRTRKTSPWPLGSLKGFILSGGSPAWTPHSGQLATPLWPAGPAVFLSFSRSEPSSVATFWEGKGEGLRIAP